MLVSLLLHWTTPAELSLRIRVHNLNAYLNLAAVPFYRIGMVVPIPWMGTWRPSRSGGGQASSCGPAAGQCGRGLLNVHPQGPIIPHLLG